MIKIKIILMIILALEGLRKKFLEIFMDHS